MAQCINPSKAILKSSFKVQALDFSEMHPELMATAYSDDPSDVLAPAGIVHLWNTRFKNRTPE